MSEEKILEGDEGLNKNQDNIENGIIKNESTEQKEAIFEKRENNAQEKIKQAEDQIAAGGSSVQKDEEDEEKVESYAEDVAGLDTAEDQIKKLTEIATQNSPKMALKVAQVLNSNYILDEMHDRLIDETELREILLKKGFIENI